MFCFEENDTFKENSTQVMVVYLNFLNLTCFSERGSRLSELQITEGIEDNSKITFLISHQKHMLLPFSRTVSERRF